MKDSQREVKAAIREASESYNWMQERPLVKGLPAERRPLRVWWIPQVPGIPFRQAVSSLAEGALLLLTLARYDMFQLAHRIKPDYSNAGGLEVKKGDEWEDWYDENGTDIETLTQP